MDKAVAVQDQLVVSIGEVLWDVIGNQRFIGGAPFNFAYHCRALGGKAALISRVSEDDLGADLIHRAENLNVNTGAIQRDRKHPTGIVTAEVRFDGSVSYIFPDECAWDHLRFDDQDRELIDSATILCFGTLAQRSTASRAAIMAAVSSVQTDTIIFLDLNLRAPYFSQEVITSSLNAANAVKLNEEELSVLRRLYQLGRDDETAILQVLERFNLDTVVLTRGHDGASAWTTGKAAHTASFPVEVVDTVGCGDAFGAAFISKVAAGKSLKDALEFGNLAGAFVATQQGATPHYTPAILEEFRKQVARKSITPMEDYQFPRA